MTQELQEIIKLLNEQVILPLVVYTAGVVTYVIYGAYTFSNGITGYKVTRITEPTAEHQYMDSGLLLEEDRRSGANGSATDVDLSTDKTNTILLLTNPALIYG